MARAGERPLQRAALQLEIARALQTLGRGDEAWPIAQTALGLFVSEQAWEAAADACNVLYEADQPDSLIALGHGVWLGVTFPIDPEISVNLLSHIVDDTPEAVVLSGFNPVRREIARIKTVIAEKHS